MAATPSGKDKTLKCMRLHVGGYDLSGDARTFGTLDSTFWRADTTGWDESVYNFLSDGRRQVGISGLQVLMNDDTARAIRSLAPGRHPTRRQFSLAAAVYLPCQTRFTFCPDCKCRVTSLDWAIFALNADMRFPQKRQATTLAGQPACRYLSYGAKHPRPPEPATTTRQRVRPVGALSCTSTASRAGRGSLVATQ